MLHVKKVAVHEREEKRTKLSLERFFRDLSCDDEHSASPRMRLLRELRSINCNVFG